MLMCDPDKIRQVEDEFVHRVVKSMNEKGLYKAPAKIDTTGNPRGVKNWIFEAYKKKSLTEEFNMKNMPPNCT